MKVKIEPINAVGFGPRFQARILDGYCEGQLLRAGDTENPMYEPNRARFVMWLQTTGYEVVNP